MRIFAPYAGEDPRDLSSQGVEMWTPTLVGRKTLVSNLGRMHTEERGTWTPRPNKTTGYRQVYVRGYGKAYVHWLVLASFEGALGRRVFRGSADKADNRLCNLRWRATF